MKIAVVYALLLGALAFVIYFLPGTPPPVVRGPADLVYQDFGEYWPRRETDNIWPFSEGTHVDSYFFFARPALSKDPKLGVQYFPRGHGMDIVYFPLKFRPVSISCPPSDPTRVLVGGFNNEMEAVLVEFKFDLSSGVLRLVEQKPFGDLSGLTVISDFRFEEDSEIDSVIALDGRIGRFVRISETNPPMDLVDASTADQLLGLQCILSATLNEGQIEYELSEYYPGAHGDVPEGRSLTLQASVGTK